MGLRFTPTVLGDRINLKVASEVSELSQTGSPFTTVGGVTSILPSMTTRRVDTTVQLGDGQSFVVAGLIKNNVTEAVNKFPGLGEAPIVGALFRSTEFQNDLTELMFVVTPRLVKPFVRPPVPTDNHVVPSRADVILRGEGRKPPARPARQAESARPRSPTRPEGSPIHRLILARARPAGRMRDHTDPHYDARFGDAVRQARQAQTINPRPARGSCRAWTAWPRNTRPTATRTPSKQAAAGERHQHRSRSPRVRGAP